MTNYTLDIIPGTADFVTKELLNKFPSAKILQNKKAQIEFEAETDEVDDFNILLSPLRIHKLHGPIRNLFRRDWKVDSVPAGINPALAYILCQAAEINENNVVIDPFCGGGTIAITAAKYFSPQKVLASDVSGKAIDITTKNFQAAGIAKNKFAIFRSNVSQLRLQANSVTKVISNLPFGVRTGDHEQNKIAYQALANRMKSMLKPGGRLVLFTQEKILLHEAFDSKEFKHIQEYDVEQGGLIPRVFVYEKV